MIGLHVAPEEAVLLRLDDVPLTVRVIRQARKTLAIHLTRTMTFEARAPLRMPFGEIERYLQSQTAWMAKVLSKRAALPEAQKLSYRDGAVHWFLGEQYRLKLLPATRFFAHVSDGEIRVAVNKLDEASVSKALQKFYLREAEMRLPERVRFWHRRMYQRELPELKFRAMRSRWGSCAAHGGITLNTCLLRASLPVIDYVIVHELAHLTHFDHSPRFHALVGAVLPDWQARQKQLTVPCGF